MGFIQSSNSVHLQTCSKVVKVKTFCDFLLLLFFGRLLVQRERKEATQILAYVAFTIIQKDISALSLFCLSFYWDVCQMPNLFHHRVKCCEYFHPSPTHNFAELSAVRLPCSPQSHQTLLQRRIVSELCKLSSS